MADVWANWMVCHPRATCHIAGCCHLVNSLSWLLQSHMPHCKVLPSGEFNDVVPELRVTLQGRPTATWWIHCHGPRATCHTAGCCHRANSMSWSQSHVWHCRLLPPGEFNVMIPVPRATLPGAVTWRNQCHDHATFQRVRIPFAILKIVFRHILFFFCFLNAVWALSSGGFRIVSDKLVCLFVIL